MGRKKRRRRGKGKGINFDDKYMWAFLVMIVFFLAITAYPDAMMINSSVGTTLTTILPTLLLVSMAIYMFTQVDRAGVFGGFLFIGMALSVFMGEANTMGLVTAEMLVGLTIQQAQTWIMAVSVFFGAALFAFR